MYNLFGYFPAPFVYGVIQNLTGGDESRWGMTFNFCMMLPVFIFVSVAICCKPELQDFLKESRDYYYNIYQHRAGEQGKAKAKE
jgi:hypothetical protein